MKYLGIIVLLVVACSHTPKSKTMNESIDHESPQLISWSSSFVKERDLEDFTYYDDHENFIREYFSVDYTDKQIIATTLIEVNCSDSISGRIAIAHDTIFLKYDILMTDDRLCSEFHKFRFVISNPENKHYTIISVK